MTRFIEAADLTCGDVVMNSCDPDFLSLRNPYETTMLVYKIVAYAAFANRVIVPGRYLLAPKSNAFKASVTLERLLEAGVLIPDLRVGYDSFKSFVQDRRAGNDQLYERAKWLDEHCDTVFHFDVKGESDLYRAHLVTDLDIDSGLLARALIDRRVPEQEIRKIAEQFHEKGGNRQSFVREAAAILPAHTELFARWAAMRYYSTPAEIEEAAIRDMPPQVSELINSEDMRVSGRLLTDDGRDPRQTPVDGAYEVLMVLPRNARHLDLSPLADIVLKVREECPAGAAKFQSISENGFEENLDDTNSLFMEELARERDRFPESLASRILSATISGAPFWALSWQLHPVIPEPIEVGASFLWDELSYQLGNAFKRKLNPFVETAQHLRKHVKKHYRV